MPARQNWILPRTPPQTNDVLAENQPVSSRTPPKKNMIFIRSLRAPPTPVPPSDLATCVPAPTTVALNLEVIACCLTDKRYTASYPLLPSLSSGTKASFTLLLPPPTILPSHAHARTRTQTHTQTQIRRQNKSAYCVHRTFGKLLSVDVSGTAITDDGIQLVLGASKVCSFLCLLVVVVVVALFCWW